MGYPMHEDMETATFWSNSVNVRGVRFDGRFHDQYGHDLGARQITPEEVVARLSTTGQANGGPPAHLYEVTTDEAASALNRMVKDFDSGKPWWRKLLTLIYNPEGAIKDELFEMAKNAMDASLPARRFWHDHQFARGDRIYIATHVADPTGETTIRCSCSLVSSDGHRFIQHGGSFNRREIQATDNYYGALADPPPPEEYQPYQIPNLDAYRDTLFVRFKNHASGAYLCASPDGNTARVLHGDVPYNPLQYSTYWTRASDGGGSAVKLWNAKTRKWLMRPSSDDSARLVAQYTGDANQRWTQPSLLGLAETVWLSSQGERSNLVGKSDGSTFFYLPLQEAADQQWTVETFTVDVDRVPDGKSFRIMHCQTGQYITLGQGNADHATLRPTLGTDQLFTLERWNGAYRFYNAAANVYLTYFQNWKFLGGYSNTGMVDQSWEVPLLDHRAGFQLRSRAPTVGGSNHLYYKDNDFGVFSGDYGDQLWVLQLEHS